MAQAVSGFEAMVRHHPKRRALVGPDCVTVTYEELGARVHAIAHGLRDAGLEPGDSIALAPVNSRAHVEVMLAGMILGAYVVPVNWHLTASETAYILSDAGAKVFVADERCAAAASAAAEEAGVPERGRIAVGEIAAFTSLDELATGRPTSLPEDAASSNPMFYTSGTTGRPKGIRKPLPDRPVGTIGVLPSPLEETDGVPLPLDRVHVVAGPLYYSAPFHAVGSPLDCGAFVVLMERFDAERFLELVAEYRVTDAAMVPTMFVRLLALPDDVRRKADVSSLMVVSHSGAPCPVDVKRRMIDWLGPIVTESYAASEGLFGASITSEEWLSKPGSVGKPLMPVRIYDPDSGKECPPGLAGHVYATPLWEWQYNNDPDKTARAYRDGLFTVGDIGYLDDDGYLFLCDRTADLIISGGANIYPSEVEGLLIEHPAVADVAVIGVPNDEWGEEVRAVVEPVKGVAPSDELAAELIGYARDRLAHFKCPRAVDFVDDLGRDPNGKLRKRLIRDTYWAGRDRRI